MIRHSKEEFEQLLPTLNNLTVNEAAAKLGISPGALQNNFSRYVLSVYVIDKTIHVLDIKERVTSPELATKHQNRIPLSDGDFDHLIELHRRNNRRRKSHRSPSLF